MLKAFVKYGDKVLCALIVIWAISKIIVGLTSLNSEQPIEAQVQKSQQMALTSAPKPLIAPIPMDMKSKILQDQQWTFQDNRRRSSLNFLVQKVDVNVLQKDYVAKLSSHVCEMHDSPLGDGTKACLFPGCPKKEAQEEVYIGLPGTPKCIDTSAMTVELTWEGATDLKDVTPMYCIVQRKITSGGNSEAIPWSTILDTDGSPKKIIGKSPSELTEQGNEASSALPSGFQLPVGVLANTPSETSISKNTPDKLDDIKRVYHFLDYNLDPKTKYSYRIKAVGVSKRNLTIIEGANWTDPIEVITKEDQGVGFVRFIPGLRNKEGQLVKKADGSIVSPDKVYVRLTKLFNPPWSPVRYFINYEQRNVSIGQEGQDFIGRVVSNYTISSADGSPVYIDAKKENFLYVSESLSLDAMKLQVENNKDKWKPYLMEVDFSTRWKALRVDEEIVDDKIIKTKYNAKGQVENIEESIKKYRYFLVLENLENKSNLRLELEREDLTKRLLSY